VPLGVGECISFSRDKLIAKDGFQGWFSMYKQSAAIIVAAGNSHRMQGIDKLWYPLAGRVTIARTIDIFQHSPIINEIVVVANPERITDLHSLSQQEEWHKIVAIVAGGARRQDSVCIGLDTLAAHHATNQWVMIHDGARPFATPSILRAGLEAVQTHQATVAAVQVKDTIKQVHNNTITDTPDRTQLWAIQTPQVFSFPLIHQAHHHPIAQTDVTDDASLLEQLGHTITIFPGSYTNIKITTQEDLLFAEAFLHGERSGETL
jgi:2-C-methyl-D-erythritol 4-phosphate cytidylyltransferase